ncbi:P-protein [bacterium HR17]|uniref:Bifunctional chorismate mutase/prephenate dehydratase n=1 Tax=Candidatus Fervidibacter japonicus TaxID=2035412 RepID=A0A2H5XEV9_9BACT|nr:P-protein [bacterium HR17]
MAALDEWRRQIDAIDEQILQLLVERARLAQHIALLKQQNDLPLYHPEREGSLLARLIALPHEPLTDDAVKAIFREIVSACRAVMRPPRVAFLGPFHSFSHLACEEHFGTFVEPLPQRTIHDVFREVERGNADFGIVPAENVAEGPVGDTLDALLQTPLKIVAEVLLEVNHCLLSKAADLAAVRRVYSRDIALAQCRQWLQNYLPQVELIAVASTAEGAERAATDAEGAAIGPRRAADAYGLQVLAERIQDVPFNLTRFWVLGKRMTAPSGVDKTTIAFSVQHRPGTLYRALSAFARHHINLTMIASRPARHAPWEYVFFADFQGHVQDDPVQAALSELGKECLFLKVLGSYPEAIEAL